MAGRDEQKAPKGDWRTWLLMGGRGSGKTRAGAEWVQALANAPFARGCGSRWWPRRWAMPAR